MTDASVRLDRQAFVRVLDDADALDELDRSGDTTILRDLFANLTVFTTQALIEP